MDQFAINQYMNLIAFPFFQLETITCIINAINIFLQTR